MKYYSGKPGIYAKMPGGLRLILALYLVSTVLGFWLSAAKYLARGLLTPSGVSEYYLGDPHADSLLGAAEPKSVGFLIDVTHPHLFTVPIVLLILCHLVQLTTVHEILKRSLYLTAFVSMFVSFLSPWLLRFAPAMSIVAPISGIALLASGTLLSVIPLRELARRRR